MAAGLAKSAAVLQQCCIFIGSGWRQSAPEQTLRLLLAFNNLFLKVPCQQTSCQCCLRNSLCHTQLSMSCATLYVMLYSMQLSVLPSPFNNAFSQLLMANYSIKAHLTCTSPCKIGIKNSECQTAFTFSLDFRIFCAWSRSCCGHAARSFSMAEMAASAYLGDAWASFLIVLPLMVMTCSDQISNLFFILSGMLRWFAVVATKPWQVR